jgi:hypothetical protein
LIVTRYFSVTVTVTFYIQGASGIDARFLKFTKTIAENP